MKDPTDLSDLQISDENLKRYLTGNTTLSETQVSTENGNKVSPVRRYKKQGKVKWYRLEASVLDQAFATADARRNAWSILAILMALFELWYTDSNHRNPVALTSYNLQRFGLTRWQKYRALQILEGAKVIIVDRTAGKNPLITLTWLLLRH